MEAFNPKILIIDDSADNLKLLGTALKRQFYNVLTALNGKQGLALVQSKRPDLILLDVMMPGIDGYEVCYRIKENPLTSDIPVIFISALNQPEYIQKGYRAGASDYLLKPLNINDLGLRIKNIIRVKSKLDFNKRSYSLLRELVGLKKFEYQEVDHYYPTINELIDLFMTTVIDTNWTLLNTFKLHQLQTFLIDNAAGSHCFTFRLNLNDQRPYTAFPLFKLFYKFLVQIIEREIKAGVDIDANVKCNESGSNYLVIEFKGDNDTISLLYSITNQTSWHEDPPYSIRQQCIFSVLLELLSCKMRLMTESPEHKLEMILPLTRGRYLDTTASEIPPPERNRASGILCIEDNPVNIEYLSSVFEELNIEYSIVDTAQKALERLMSENFDIILSDLNLPDMHGNELVKKIRKDVCFTGPIVAISGCVQHEIISESLECGFSDFLTKPFTIRDITQLIKKHKGNIVKESSAQRTISSKGEYDLSHILQLAGNDPALVKEWLQSFCLILRSTKTAINALKEKQNYTERIKSFHDLRNYASYFDISDIIQVMDLLQELKSHDGRNSKELNKVLHRMEDLVAEATKQYENVLKELH
jgi:CheY-like chemotaxis protein